jgi:hypothetical protein
MELALASIMVDISMTVAGWLHQSAVSKKDRKTLELVSTIQSFGSGEYTKEWTASELLRAMEGRLTVPMVSTVLETASFTGLAKEIFLSELTGASTNKKDATKLSLRIYFRQNLPDDIKKDHSRNFSDFIYRSIRDNSASWIKQLREKHPEALTNLSSMATNRRIHATLDAIENHLYLSRQFDRGNSSEEWEMWQDKYARQVVHAHGFIQPPDFNNSRRISIDDLYVAQNLLNKLPTQTPSMTIDRCLSALIVLLFSGIPVEANRLSVRSWLPPLRNALHRNQSRFTLLFEITRNYTMSCRF